MATPRLNPLDATWRPHGVSVATLVQLDTREASMRPVWEANPDALTTNSRSARAVIDSNHIGDRDGPIYVHGESLEEIAAWLERAAAELRAFTPEAST